MTKINLNNVDGVDLLLFLFPDNQPHVTIGCISRNVQVMCSITDSKKLLELCMLFEILNRQDCVTRLYIPYLMGARYDRVMDHNGSFDLKVICNIINSLKAKTVCLYDPHSDVAPALINNSYVVTNEDLVRCYDGKEAVLIIPDAGAAKKAHKYQEWNKNIIDIVHCVKHRELSTGKIDIKVLEPEKCEGRNCVIIDDLCDGGFTFNMIAEQIKPLTNTLIVTHGIFSRGFKELENHFTEIITSNSYKETYDSKIVKVIKW